jgi:hypothetical protein
MSSEQPVASSMPAWRHQMQWLKQLKYIAYQSSPKLIAAAMGKELPSPTIRPANSCQSGAPPPC